MLHFSLSLRFVLIRCITCESSCAHLRNHLRPGLMHRSATVVIPHNYFPILIESIFCESYLYRFVINGGHVVQSEHEMGRADLRYAFALGERSSRCNTYQEIASEVSKIYPQRIHWINIELCIMAQSTKSSWHSM